MSFMEFVELIAVLLNTTYVILAVKQKILCWPFGIAGCGISVWYFQEIGLIAESALNVFYVIMGFYGWWAWTNKGQQDEKPIVRSSIRGHLTLIMLGGLFTVLLGYVLTHIDRADLTYFDSFTTAFALVATYLTARKVLENWLYWIVVDLSSIALYLIKDTELYAGLAAVYTVMSIYGYFDWKRNYDAARNTA